MVQPALIQDFEGMPEVRFGDGETVVVEGEPSRGLMVLVSGAVRVSARGAALSVVDRPGALFGEMALLLGGPATATVTAQGDCTFLHAENPVDLMRRRPGVALGIAVTLARRLDVATRELVQVRERAAGDGSGGGADGSGRGGEAAIADRLLRALAQA